MNQRIIWLIIGLMAAALIGSSYLQVNWITSSKRLNEEKFDKAVYEALNKVSEQLQRDEVEKGMDYANGFEAQFYQQQAQKRLEESLQTASSLSQALKLPKDHITETLLHNNSCNCLACRFQRMFDYLQIVTSSGSFENEQLDERINLEMLDKYLNRELTNRGIQTEYQYGVYSLRKKAFVIENGHYQVEQSGPQAIQAGYSSLYTSPYKVSLFSADQDAPGFLYVHFPDKTSVVWSSLWGNLLASVLFTGIILFCFAYTITVIFRQKKLSEMKTDFINNMTHEFKTPIATISLAADSITNPMILGNESKIRRFADIIKQENRRMNSQVEKVLQMALLDKQDFKLNYAEVDMHQVITRAVENISLQVEKKDGTVSTDLSAANSMMEGDLTHLSNIINNLLDNANKYTPEKPEIQVNTRDVANGIEITVSDNGIGMSKEARKHIFDKFYRVSTGNLHDVKGFGLGLSYVKAMVVAHRGQIEVQSEPGKGSSFILTFPRRQDA